MIYSVRLFGIEIFSTRDELTAYAYKNLCQGSVVVAKFKRRKV